MKKKIFKKMTAVVLTAAMVLTAGVWQAPKAEADIYLSEGLNRVSVHDPSIFKDKDTNTYYVFGSHMATGSSKDLMNWTQVSRDYQNITNNSVYGDIDTNLAEPFLWAGKDDSDCKGGHAIWAPDVIYNPSYKWADGTKGAYMMYLSTSSTSVRSCIGFGVSKTASGPYTYVKTVIYSGFTKTSATDSKSTIDKKWDNSYLNLKTLFNNGTLSGSINDVKWFSGNNYNNAYAPNAIDPTVFFGNDGKFYMTYGSWSGGIFMLELDPVTGEPKYPGKDGTESTSGNWTDRYFGTHIAGGSRVSGEAPYIYYDKEAGYYYLYITYGWLAADGGYNMRLFRSKNPYGPYEDAAGRQAQDSSKSLNNYGIKLIGNYQFKGQTGYKAAGHNSAFIDDGGQRYLFYHQRFNKGAENHELRVRQQFLNEDNWPVDAVYEYQGESIGHYNESQVTGAYEVVNHGTATDGKMIETTYLRLKEDGTVQGTLSGTWKKTTGKGKNYDYLTIQSGGKTYKGFFYEQYSENWENGPVMTFSLVGSDNTCVWGSKTDESNLKDYGYVAGTEEKLVGKGWWQDPPTSKTVEKKGDFTYRFHVRMDELTDNYGAFNMEISSDTDNNGQTNENGYYITTGSDINAWFAGGAGEQQTGATGGTITSPDATLGGNSELAQGHTYQVSITRKGQDFTIVYEDEATGKTMYTIEAKNTNLGPDVKMWIKAQVGTLAVVSEGEKKAPTPTPTNPGNNNNQNTTVNGTTGNNNTTGNNSTTGNNNTTGNNSATGNNSTSGTVKKQTTSKKTLKKIKLSAVKAKKGKKVITGKVSVKKATVTVKVGKKTYKGKKVKISGKKFKVSLKAKLKKKQKVVITVKKGGYKTLKKTYKVK